ncbi:MAG: hypothetical protein ACLUD2_09215 [Clostridium sp.]
MNPQRAGTIGRRATTRSTLTGGTGAGPSPHREPAMVFTVADQV